MITSADNPKVKQARALLERRGRRLQGHCLAEGLRLIQDAMRAGSTPALVFFTAEARVAGPAAELLEKVSLAGVPVWELSPAVFATLSDTVNSQGLVAVFPIPMLPTPSEPGLALVVDQVRDPGNLGTILRTADAASVDLVLLLHGTADPWNPKVLRAGMGAHFRLPLSAGVTWESVPERLAGCAIWLADARGDRVYDEIDWTARSALVLAGETTGASPEAAGVCRGRIAIPMPGGAESLNVAAAGAILLFEAVRQRRRATQVKDVFGNSGRLREP